MYYLNKGTAVQSGSGHPWVDRLEYLFCVRKSSKDITLGIPKVPIGYLPTGQFHVLDFSDFLSANLRVSNGDGTLGASTPIPQVAFLFDEFEKDGNINWVSWSTDSSYVLAGATAGRYVIELNLLSDVEGTFYSEEFFMSNCC